MWHIVLGTKTHASYTYSPSVIFNLDFFTLIPVALFAQIAQNYFTKRINHVVVVVVATKFVFP